MSLFLPKNSSPNYSQLQQAEADEQRQKEANMTALAAIGPRKKRKLDFNDSQAVSLTLHFGKMHRYWEDMF